jgi:hypothetical protein
MKTLACLMLLVGAMGCATNDVATVQPGCRTPQSPAAAMVFTPRPALHDPSADLGRSGRDVVAYAGFEELSISTSFVRQDDDLRSGFSSGSGIDSRFRRRAISTTVRQVAR